IGSDCVMGGREEMPDLIYVTENSQNYNYLA
ncbi:MAG: hypothetical protein JWP57_382, partial [Spirosoma sp.]|nr:hypothetical protein [Spirosoma sp.]